MAAPRENIPERPGRWRCRLQMPVVKEDESQAESDNGDGGINDMNIKHEKTPDSYIIYLPVSIQQECDKNMKRIL